MQDGGNPASYQAGQGSSPFKRDPIGMAEVSAGGYGSQQQINGAQRPPQPASVNAGQAAVGYYGQQSQTDPYQRWKQSTTAGSERQQISVAPMLSQHAPLQSYNTSQLMGNLPADGTAARTNIGVGIPGKSISQVPLHGVSQGDNFSASRRTPGVSSMSLANHHQYVPPAKRETTPTQPELPKKQVAIPKLWNSGETPRAGYAGTQNLQNLPQYKADSNGMQEGTDTSFSDSARSEVESP
mmetsp:Transcript_24507/g.38566  ORF Transcript_24507/g.38566 Transcript_24507/m.38566 type:complete len:240 (-) Transcript_24507:283-1002(-)